MKRRPLVIIAVILGIALLGAFISLVTSHQSLVTRGNSISSVYYCPMHPSYTSDRPGDCPICNMRLVKREVQGSGLGAQGQPSTGMPKDICYLHNCDKLHEGRPCPMTVIAKPGEVVVCPVCGKYIATKDGRLKKVLYWTDPMIPGYKAEGPGKSPMGMDLVPVYEEEAGTPNAVTDSTVEGYAPILLPPQKQQLIGVKTSLVQIRPLRKTIRTVGRIAYDPELYQTQAEYVGSLKALADAKIRATAEGIEEAQRLIDSTRIKLQLMGLNQELIEEMAGWQGPDKRLLLADAEGQVWLYAPVYEFELPLVKVGHLVSVEIPELPGTVLQGTIRSIDSVLDPMTRSARVRAVLTAPPGTLKPEMYVNASILVDLGEVLAVPEEAVFDTGTKRVVFVDKGQGLFEPRDVTIGVKADGFYEVHEGLQAGEIVVTSGNFLIDSESRLKAALEGSGSGGHQHGQ